VPDLTLSLLACAAALSCGARRRCDDGRTEVATGVAPLAYRWLRRWDVVARALAAGRAAGHLPLLVGGGGGGRYGARPGGGASLSALPGLGGNHELASVMRNNGSLLRRILRSKLSQVGTKSRKQSALTLSRPCVYPSDRFRYNSNRSCAAVRPRFVNASAAVSTDFRKYRIQDLCRGPIRIKPPDLGLYRRQREPGSQPESLQSPYRRRRSVWSAQIAASSSRGSSPVILVSDRFGGLGRRIAFAGRGDVDWYRLALGGGKRIPYSVHAGGSVRSLCSWPEGRRLCSGQRGLGC